LVELLDALVRDPDERRRLAVAIGVGPHRADVAAHVRRDRELLDRLAGRVLLGHRDVAAHAIDDRAGV
jgi:hypothetical protein